MNRYLCLLLVMVFSLVADAQERGAVFLVPLKTEVSQAQFLFLRRALKTAEREQASAFVIEMETYGGDVKAAIDNMDALLKTKVPTYTFVNSRAISAGALIAIATQKIYMSPAAVIGAAAPVMAGGEDLPKTMSEKTISTLAAMARAASQKNGRNPEIADAFIDGKKQVKIGEVVIDGSDSLLTLSAEEAARVYDGKPLLAVGIVGSVDELLAKADLKGPVRRFEPTGFERLALWITALAPLLLLGGIIGAYIEFKVPGFGIPGIISLICFTLFFAGHYIAGLAGWEVMLCFSLGLALILGELIIHPGTVLPGLAGVVLMLGALVYAMIDRWPSQPLWPTQEMLLWPLLKLSLAGLSALVVIYLLAKHLPQSSLYQRLVLLASVPSSPVFVYPSFALQVGMNGIAHTPLRPSGKATFGDHLVDVVSQGEFIEAGSPVRVVCVEGTRVVVEVLGGVLGGDP